MPVALPQLAPAFIDLIKSQIPVGLAVSGGGDSVALLHLVAALDGNISVASVDHGLRAAAVDECAIVADICASYGMPHQVLRWHGWDGHGNLQAKARDARYRLIADWAQAAGIADIALGHTADDQAETLIMALARGAGVDGLSGMAAVTEKFGLRFHRPLLQVTRAELRIYLKTANHIWCDDPSNDDPAYERIRIRQAADMLSRLGLTPQALGQVAQHMAAAARALERQTNDLVPYLLRQHGDMLITLPLSDLSGEEARRLVLTAMGQVNRGLIPPRRAEQDRLMEMLRKGQATTLAGCVFSFDGPVLRIGRELAAVKDHITATTGLWDGRWRLSGPHHPDLLIRALGVGVDTCPDWRMTGLPYASMQVTPAVWQGDRLICAPLAGFGTGWIAQIVAE
ncbi:MULTISPECIES: tRNA lysidine(34) synthetase TilS [unclassified Yoonia]|uniref:tRNA lysidine(34) synthetase TilS n=1 Tax=unclassified Yoonia TaxID=2629118 RepID=UPI002B001535|nr:MULTISPECIES: tRNA lysidine(34) synthetase TilS [unclassified Yoonia]